MHSCHFVNKQILACAIRSASRSYFKKLGEMEHLCRKYIQKASEYTMKTQISI